jgi:hypothetical protein
LNYWHWLRDHYRDEALLYLIDDLYSVHRAKPIKYMLSSFVLWCTLFWQGGWRISTFWSLNLSGPQRNLPKAFCSSFGCSTWRFRRQSRCYQILT